MVKLNPITATTKKNKMEYSNSWHKPSTDLSWISLSLWWPFKKSSPVDGPSTSLFVLIDFVTSRAIFLEKLWDQSYKGDLNFKLYASARSIYLPTNYWILEFAVMIAIWETTIPSRFLIILLDMLKVNVFAIASIRINCW